MTATLVERLGALGDLTLTHTWDPLLYKLLRKDALVRIWKGEKVYAASIVTRRGGDARQGITIGGRDPRTLLGHDNWGPVIERREFIAGTTRLSNGEFAMLDPAIPTYALFWTFTEGTSWEATGTGLVRLNPGVVPLKDDVLLAQEQPPALAGQQWEATATVAWPSPGPHPEGKLRLRLIWFGHFDNPELLTNPSFELGPGAGWGMAPFMVVEAGGALTGTCALRAGTIPKPQLVVNPTLAGGTGWARPDATDITDPLTGDISIINDPLESYALHTTPLPLTITDMGTFSSWIASMPNGTSYPTFESNSLGDAHRGSLGYVQDYDGHWITSSTPPTPVPLTITDMGTFDSWIASMPNGTSYPTFEANSLGDPNRGVDGYVQDFDGHWITSSMPWVMACEPNTKPQYLTDPGFELGPGAPWSVPTAGDMGYVSDAAKAHGGLWAVRVGPIIQKQLIINPTFDVVGHWYENTELVDPSTGIYYYDAGQGMGAVHATPVPLTITDVGTFNSWIASMPNGTPYLTFESNSLGDPHFAAPGYVQDYDGHWITSSTAPTPVPLTITDVGTFNSWIASMPNGTPYLTFESNSLGDPHFAAPGYVQDFDGHWITESSSQAYTTQGFAGAPNSKFVRAQFDGTSGVAPATVIPGEEYLLEGWVWAAPSTDGRASMYGHIPHPSVPNHEQWFPTQEMQGGQISVTPAKWYRLFTNIAVPPNRTKLNVGLDVFDHHAGYWHWDNVTLTRIRGNRDRMDSVSYPVVAGNAYRLYAFVRSGDGHTDGSTRLGVVLTGPGKVDETHDVDQGPTDFVWTMPSVDFTPTDGYTAATPFIMGVDVNGDSMYVDDMRLYKVSNNSAEVEGTIFPVVADQRYLLSAPIRQGPLVTRGSVTVGVKLNGAGVSEQIVSVSKAFDQATADKWEGKSIEVRPPPCYTTATPFVRSTDIEDDIFWVGKVELVKMDNNTDAIAGTAFLVTPERSYHWVASARSGTALQSGTVKLSVRLTAPSRPDQIIDSSPMADTKGEWQLLTFDFTPPSGYTMAIPSVVGTDIDGDVFHVDDMGLTDADGTTRVIDFVASALGDLTIGATAPAGTEKVGVALVAEAGGYSWRAGPVVLHRIGEAIPTAAEVVDALLHDPVSGEYLLLPGNIVGSDTLRHDWLIEWQSLRASLIHLSTAGVVEPLREDRVRIDDNGDLRYDWATADQLYQDRGALVLTNSQPIVVDGVSVDENTEAQVERVVVIGATKADAKGRPVQIIGVASNAPTGDDWRRNPVTRTLVVTDAAAETVAYANSLARFHLDRAAVSVVNTSATLSNWEATSAFDVGDWVHPENRDAGLENGGAAVELGGETVYPARERVVGRTTRMGQEEFWAEVLDTSTGEWVPLPGVEWEKSTTAQVELGTVRPDFLADPQNGSAITQFNEFALSNGR